MPQLCKPQLRPTIRYALRYGVWFALLALVLPVSARSEALEQQLLSKTFETRIREVLERHVPAREFSVLVTATPNGKKLPNTPYAPKGGSVGAFSTLPLEELDTYVGKLQVEVLLSKRLTKQRRQIEDLIQKNVKLRPNRGDRVNFSPLGIEITSDEWERERTTLRQEINLARAETERLNRELQSSLLSRSTASSTAKETEVKEKSTSLELVPYIIGGLGFLALVVMLFFARSLSRAGDSLSDAIGTIGEAMAAANSASQVIVETERSGGGGNQSFEAKATIETKGGGGMAQLPMESLYSHLLKMHEAIMAGYDDGVESIVVRHLNSLLQSPATTGRGLALLEFLGQDQAKKLFARIGVEAQDALRRFQQEGAYPKSKIEMMMEAAEDLRTKIMMESFNRAVGKPSDRVSEGIAQLADDDLVQLVTEVKVDLMPRLFLYFQPGKIAFLLDRLKRQAPDRFTAAVRLLPKMPEVTKVGEMDGEIETALKAVLTRTSADAERPFLKIYKEIVESSSNEMREEIVKALSTNARIKSYFQENIISLATFFALPEALRGEILEALSNKEYAALLAGSTGEDQKELDRLIPGRRRELILEEVETVKTRGGHALTAAFNKSRDMVVVRIRAMKAEGRLPKEKKGAASGDKKAA